MTVKECYVQMRGDYEDVRKRFGNDVRIQKYLVKFLDDRNFAELRAALEAGDARNGFVHVHNLKGMCANLGMKKLIESSSALCEELRGGEHSERAAGLLEELEEDYDRTVGAIRGLLEG